MKIALVYSSKAGMASSVTGRLPVEQRDEEDEPPPDYFAECDSDETIEAVVTETCRILRVKDWCRIDVRLDERGEPNILEVNPLPGILPKPEDNSCLPKAARTAGYTYGDLILRVADEASARWNLAGGGRA